MQGNQSAVEPGGSTYLDQHQRTRKFFFFIYCSVSFSVRHKLFTKLWR